ncbi:MAG: PepSY domain-containing protein [Robiginitomaculum sp.]|nr:PepSY domain-containing protein [Robiginitomaculum sp.]
MMKLNRHIILGLVVATLALPAGTAAASSAQDAPDMSYILNVQQGWKIQGQNRIEALYAQQRRPQRKISASRAKAAAMRQHRGAKFVNVQLVNQATYRVRLQKNGRIVDVYVDAYTGQVKN